MRTIAAILAALFLVPAALPAGAAGEGGSDIPVPPSVTLLEAVQAALSRSREGRIASRDVRLTEEGRTIAGSPPLPRLDAGTDLTVLTEPPAVIIQGREVQTMEHSVLRARLTAEQTLYDFGKTGSRVSGAEARIDASEKRAEENLRIQNDRYREGLAISTEVLDAREERSAAAEESPEKER